MDCQFNILIKARANSPKLCFSELPCFFCSMIEKENSSPNRSSEHEIDPTGRPTTIRRWPIKFIKVCISRSRYLNILHCLYLLVSICPHV